jgi:hypothetical protein
LVSVLVELAYNTVEKEGLLVKGFAKDGCSVFELLNSTNESEDTPDFMAMLVILWEILGNTSDT